MSEPITDKRRAEIEHIKRRLDCCSRPFDYELRAAMRDLLAEVERMAAREMVIRSHLRNLGNGPWNSLLKDELQASEPSS